MTRPRAVTPFQFNSLTLRTITQGSEPWFVAADVCKHLGINNSTDAVGRLLAQDKARLNLGLRGSPPTIVNESGLYDLILQSRKPAAREFRRWVTAEVLPTIRKTGGALRWR